MQSCLQGRHTYMTLTARESRKFAVYFPEDVMLFDFFVNGIKLLTGANLFSVIILFTSNITLILSLKFSVSPPW